MKKLIFTAIFALLSASMPARASDQISEPKAFSFGWELSPSFYSIKQTGVKSMSDLEKVYLSEHFNTFGAFIGIDAKIYDRFRIFTSVETFEDFSNREFAPYEGIYTFGVEFKYRNIIVGAAHDCTHPIINSAQGNSRNFTNNRQGFSSQNSTLGGEETNDALYKEGANTKVYVRIRGGFGW